MPLRAWKLFGQFFWLALLSSAAPAAFAVETESAVLLWNDAALQAVRDTHPGPPQCARAMAMVDTSMYDAWAAYDPLAVGTRLGGALRRPEAERTTDNKAEAISFAAYRTLADLFPQPDQIGKFQELMRLLGYDPGDNSTDPAQPSGVGNLAAQAVLDFRHKDGSNQMGDLHPGAYSDYTG